ncbi:MAG TPA: D-alanyl-D-alanine carboxypeptidase family protein [Stellaceae bacterium]|nr:D-alanyl-D-alanine carboxypeptidase family protein [Stellaceae bacterium]
MGALNNRKRFRGFAVRVVLVAAVAAWFFSAEHSARASYSSIVIDADTGRVVMEHRADAQNYPASLTKMMTLYLTFQGLEQHKLSLQQEFTVSAHAAAQAPSKLGLRPGERVALKDLIFAIVTHSANDAAVVIAENIAGSEPAFAERMTRQAHALGMRNTHFANASGLPNPANVTTARDLAMLALALYRDFPKEYGYFATEDFTFRGVTYANHNHLMSHFAGMDGIKTGYIRASGFNLAASAVRDGRRLVAVVMGGESAHSRDLQMAALLNQAFTRQGGEPVEVADDSDGGAKDDTVANRAGRAIAALSPVGHAEAATTARPAPRRAHHATGWSIQVGAFAQRGAAEHAAMAALARLHGAAHGRVVQVVGPGHAEKDALYRARIVHFTEHQAQAACRALHLKHKGCVVISPDSDQMAAAK